MATFKTLTFQHDGRIATLTINRPEALNALNNAVFADLHELFAELKAHPCAALIVTGAGEKAFVAGADIKEMEPMTPPQAREFALRGQALFRQLEDFSFPTIAAVNGFMLGGGCELALACDWIVASTKAKWGLPEVTLGLIPGCGGTQRLSRVIGKSLAKRVALTGETFTAEQGLSWGLFTQLAEPGELMNVVRKQAEVIASRGPVAVGLTKKALERGFDETLPNGLKLEAELFGQVFQSQDHLEGMRAFIEKRPSNFKGE